jgi:hypothetical protein
MMLISDVFMVQLLVHCQLPPHFNTLIEVFSDPSCLMFPAAAVDISSGRYFFCLWDVEWLLW